MTPRTVSINEGWQAAYDAQGDEMRDGWLAMLGAGREMPRNVTLPIAGSKKKWQAHAATEADYIRILEEHAGRSDAWVNWAPSDTFDLEQMDYIFGDVDSPDLNDALVRARRFEEKCMADFEVQPATLFTVGKGFHMHFTLDPIPAVGTAFSDAFAALIRDAGVYLDLGPLKHRTGSGRVPYTLNLKATGLHRKPMHVVPVDLTWSLDDMKRASAQIHTLPFEIPHSPVLRGMMLPAVEAAIERRKAFMLRPAAQQAQRMDLKRAAIAFCENAAWRMQDGRRRVLSSLYIPALMIESDGDAEAVLPLVQMWVERSGANWKDYRAFAEDTAKHCVRKDNTLRLPMGLKRFFSENPGLRIPPPD